MYTIFGADLLTDLKWPSFSPPDTFLRHNVCLATCFGTCYLEYIKMILLKFIGDKLNHL